MKLQIPVAAALLASVLFIPVAQAELSGMLTVSRQYNQSRHVTQADYVDASGHVTVAQDKGYATVRRDYDGAGNIASELYFDADGQLKE